MYKIHKRDFVVNEILKKSTQLNYLMSVINLMLINLITGFVFDLFIFISND